MIFNAIVGGIEVTIEAESKRAAFLKTLEAISSTWNREIKLYYLSRMSDAEFESMIESHPFIRLENPDA